MLLFGFHFSAVKPRVLKIFLSYLSLELGFQNPSFQFPVSDPNFENPKKSISNPQYFQLEIRNSPTNGDVYEAQLIEPLESLGNGGGNPRINQAFSAYGASVDFQNVLQDLPLFVNYARKEDFQTAQRSTDRGGGGIGDFKKLVIAKYGKISAAQKVRN